MPGLEYHYLLIVVTAAVLAPLVVDLLRLPDVPVIVVEIVAGILIGPQVLGIVEVDEPVQVLSQIGLVFLFFLAGLEIAFRSETERHLGLIGAAFALSLALAVAAAHVLEAVGLVDSPLLIAIILAATAFGIVVAVLKDAGQTRTDFGQLVIAGASVADFGTVVLLSLFFSHQGSGIEATLLLLGLFAGVVVALGMAIRGVHRSGWLSESVDRMHETTAQIGVRIAVVLLVGLVYLAEEFGLEVVLGAFLAGAMVSLLDREEAMERSGEKAKLEAIGFGVFVPAFFVTSGVRLDLTALFDSVSAALLVPAIVAALLVVRGVPAVLYREHVGRRRAVAAGLLQATSLPFIVAAAQIGVELGKIDTATAAGLVAAGVLSVLAFPVVALGLMRERLPTS